MRRETRTRSRSGKASGDALPLSASQRASGLLGPLPPSVSLSRTSAQFETPIPCARDPTDLLLILRVPAVVDEVPRAAVLVPWDIRVVPGEPALALPHEHRAVHLAD